MHAIGPLLWVAVHSVIGTGTASVKNWQILAKCRLAVADFRVRVAESRLHELKGVIHCKRPEGEMIGGVELHSAETRHQSRGP